MKYVQPKTKKSVLNIKEIIIKRTNPTTKEVTEFNEDQLKVILKKEGDFTEIMKKLKKGKIFETKYAAYHIDKGMDIGQSC